MKTTKKKDIHGNTKETIIEQSELETKEEKNTSIIHSIIWGMVVISICFTIYMCVKIVQ